MPKNVFYNFIHTEMGAHGFVIWFVRIEWSKEQRGKLSCDTAL